MTTKDNLISDFSDPAFQEMFKRGKNEMTVPVKEWKEAAV